MFNCGAAYVFERNLGGADAWGEAAILHASDAQREDFFGRSVAISGFTAIVGAPHEDGGPGDPRENSGAAYVYLLGISVFADGFESGDTPAWSATVP